MTSRQQNPPQTPFQDKDEIFKSLSHQIRRDIISLLGQHKSLTFSEIKKELGEIDSPSLSYHLKSLKYLIEQTANLYNLTDMGKAALNLIDHVDQSERLRKSKKRFITANVVTIVCWSIILFVVPFSLRNFLPAAPLITIAILLNVVAQINFQIIWRLFGTSGHVLQKPKKNFHQH